MTNIALTNAVQPVMCGTHAPLHRWCFDVGDAKFGLYQYSDFGLTYFGKPETDIFLGWWNITVPLSAPVTLGVCCSAIAFLALLAAMLRRRKGGADAA